MYTQYVQKGFQYVHNMYALVATVAIDMQRAVRGPRPAVSSAVHESISNI